MLHYTGDNSAKSTRDYFENPRIDAGRAELARAGAVNVSAHFVVDRDGTIYRLQPERRFARHCIGLNHLAIGIENVGDDAKYPLTDAQVIADAALIRDLAARFPITHLLGHSEVMTFRDHPYYLERDPTYRSIKHDPGPQFMSRVRALVADVKLAGPSRQRLRGPPFSSTTSRTLRIVEALRRLSEALRRLSPPRARQTHSPPDTEPFRATPEIL